MLSEPEKESIFIYLAEFNDQAYNLTKAAEELQELALILIQKVNKEESVPDKKIIDEIGDVEIRLNILMKKFSVEAVKERVNKKLTKFQGYIETNKYKNI